MQLQHSNKTINQRKEAGMLTFNLREFDNYLQKNSNRKWVKEGYLIYNELLLSFIREGMDQRNLSIEIPESGGYTTIVAKNRKPNGYTIKFRWDWNTNAPKTSIFTKEGIPI